MSYLDRALRVWGLAFTASVMLLCSLVWPKPDSVGNLLIHASTADRIKAAYAIAVRYISEQWRKCRDVAEERQSEADAGVTVEVEP